MSRFREIGATTFSALCCFHAAGQCIEPLFGARHISIPYQPTSVTAADVDNDGNADLIVACGLANRLLVLQGQGDGTVYESGSYTLGSGSTGQGPQVVIAVDINDDGLADLITANRSSADITVLKNLGFGVFDSPHTVAVGGSPWSVESGDVNNDGHVDLVVAQGTDTSGSVTVLVNTGAGNFGTPVTYSGDVGTTYAMLDDINGDGFDDLVSVSSVQDRVRVRVNNGSGVFSQQTTWDIGDSLYFVDTADFNDDGIVDIATAGELGLYVSHGLFGTGLFAAPVQVPGFGYATVADLNNDSLPDLSSVGVEINFNNQGAGFLAQKTYLAGDNQLSMVAVDLNNDGWKDIVTADFDDVGLSVLMGKGDGVFTGVTKCCEDLLIGGKLHVVDINSDGLLDIVTSRTDPWGVVVKYATDELTYGTELFIPTSQVSYMDTGDIDSDGDIDVVVSLVDEGRVGVLKNTDGVLAFDDSYPLINGIKDIRPSLISIADYNNDGLPDVSTIASFEDTFYVLENAGDGTLLFPTTYPVTRPNSLQSFDVDNDGDIDAVITPNANLPLAVFKNDGNGSFSAFSGTALPGVFGVCTPLDLDNDGDIDLVGPRYEGANLYSVVAVLNDGTGFFEPYQQVIVGPRMFWIAAGDLNGDGWTDVAFAYQEVEKSIGFILNDGTGSLAQLSKTSYGDMTSILTIADLNNDGADDIVVRKDGLWLFYNNCPHECKADCDGSGVLSIFDYICFGNAYANQDPYADCDGNGSLSIFDYICFGNAYSTGCP